MAKKKRSSSISKPDIAAEMALEQKKLFNSEVLDMIGGIDMTKLSPLSESVKKAGMDSEQMMSVAFKAHDMLKDIDTTKLSPLSESMKKAGMDSEQMMSVAFKAHDMLKGIDTTKLSPLSEAYKSITRCDPDQNNLLASNLSMIGGVNTSKLFQTFDSLKPIAGLDWEQMKFGASKAALDMMNGLDTSWLSSASKTLKGVAGMDLDQILSNAPSNINRLTGLTFDQLRANTDFTDRIDKLDRDYSFEPDNELNDRDISLDLVSENTVRIPVDEVKKGFGLLSLLKDVSENEMIDFMSHLLEYPMLALEHKVGRLIRNTVKDLAKNVRVKGSFYHCRTIDEGSMPYAHAEMFAAPDGVSSQGRFNTTGKGYLYVSRKEETAILEMKQPEGTIYDIIKWDFDQDIVMLDLTDKDLPLFRSCMYKASSNANIKKEYLVSNFFSQCCHILNIDAIKYKSVLTPNVSNYVFIDYRERWFKCPMRNTIRI